MPTSDGKASAKKTQVLLVEDHPIVRHGLRMLIDDEPDLHVCGEAESKANAWPLVRQLRPDVAVIDIALSDGSGLDLIQQIHDAIPSLPLLALSMHDENVYAERALRAGAKGYIMKREAMDKLMTAIRRVISGELYVSDAMASRLVSKLVDPAAAASAAGQSSPTVEALTEREFQVFRLIAEGVGPTQIAKRLSLSVKTVETHREHVKDKLGLKSGVELTRFALKWAMDHQ
jgi:DNA-binding NarL/FixJ family response regulator